MIGRKVGGVVEAYSCGLQLVDKIGRSKIEGVCS